MSRNLLVIAIVIVAGSGCTANRMELRSTAALEPVSFTGVRHADGTPGATPATPIPVEVEDGSVAIGRRSGGSVTMLQLGDGSTLELDHAEFDGGGAALTVAKGVGMGLAPAVLTAPLLLFTPAVPALPIVWAVANGTVFVGASAVGVVMATWTSHRVPEAVAIDASAGTVTSTPPDRARLIPAKRPEPPPTADDGPPPPTEAAPPDAAPPPG